MTTFRAAWRRALAALALLALAGCTGAEAAAPPAVPVYEPHPAMAIVERLAGDGGLPDLVGHTADEAARELRALGLAVQVVAYDEGPVSAQYPEAGAPAPADGRVVVWTGEPPAPPPPPPRPSRDAARDEPAATPSPEPGSEPVPDAVPDPEPAAMAAATPEPAVAPDPAPARAEPSTPHPPRTNPRRLPATEPGAVLAGRASWYGAEFAGRGTACGSVFDPDAFTLATRELRCGTRVRVTGPSGSTVEAVATDWGPAEWTGRRFDLSHATFAAIHSPGAGVVDVRVEVLP